MVKCSSKYISPSGLSVFLPECFKQEVLVGSTTNRSYFIFIFYLRLWDSRSNALKMKELDFPLIINRNSTYQKESKKPEVVLLDRDVKRKEF